MKLALRRFHLLLYFLMTSCIVSYAASPDLIITDIWSEGTVIHYQIQNIGEGDCDSSHSTKLYIDDVYRTSDVITAYLKAGARLNRTFLNYEWVCSGGKQLIKVVADGDGTIAESSETNNIREETWYCDQQAPRITEGPTVTETSANVYTVTWKTDENSNSAVLYHRKVGLFNTKNNATMTQDHSIALTGLVKGVPYRYKVRSADASGNTVESGIHYFFTTGPSDPNAPVIQPPAKMEMTRPLFPLRFDADASDNDEVDRVKFMLDGQLVMTDYDPPFVCYLDPERIGLSPETYFGLDHTMMAQAWDRSSNTASNTVAWGERPRCAEMELEIDLGTMTTIYTPDAGIYSFEDEFEIMARADSGLVWIDYGEGPYPDASGTRWKEVDEVTVYYDDVLWGTIIPDVDETDLTFPFTVYYMAAPSTHEIKVKIQTGMCTLTRRATIRVVRQVLDLSAERSVTRTGSTFDVAITLSNSGTTSAILDTLAEEAEGFQITVPPSSLYEATVIYDPQTRRSRVEYDFSAEVYAGGSRTFHYTAIPILSEGVEGYQLGENNELTYHNTFGDTFTEPTLAPVSRVGGVRIPDAVQDACDESDYLIVTNPAALFGIHSDDSVNQLLAKAAELASVRNGILAYYLGAGTIRTDYRRSDKIGCGNIFDDWMDEVVLMDESEDLIRIYSPNKQRFINNDVLPISHAGLHSNDVLLVGNLDTDDDPSYPEDEIAIIDGHSPGTGRGKVRVYDYQPDDDYFSSYPNRTTFDPDQGDQAIVGDMFYESDRPDLEEIIVFKGATGEVYAFAGGGYYELDHFHSIYEPGDLVAAGDLIADEDGDEIVIGDISAQQIIIYSGQGDILHQYVCTLQSSDTLQVGVDGLALADDSEDRISIRGIGEGSSWDMGSFNTNVHPDDAFMCGHVLEYGIQQYLMARGYRADHYTEGDIDVMTYADSGYSEPPGDREHLEQLLNPCGEWADKMGTDFTDGGYLLIIGETEVIPAFACSYYLTGRGREYIEFTDNYYGNTSGEMKLPEIAVGRIIGNTPEHMIDPIQTSLDVAAGDKELNFDEAYCFSGGPEERFETSRSDVVDALEDKGWHVDRHDEPSENTFYANCSDRDAIYMAAHGNYNVCWVVTSNNVEDRFDPGTTAPIVYAASCLTGRYPESTSTLGEHFLEYGASAYIGATEVSISPYNRYLSEGFFNRLNLNSPIGDALKGSKRNRMGDTNYGKYQSAIYHFFGDPKLEAFSTAAAADKIPAQTADSTLLLNAPTSVQVTIPAFTVRSTPDGDVATIPGGIVLAEPGRVEVPAWPVQIMLPAGTMVQDVQLTQVTEISSGTDLDLVEVQPNEDSEIHLGPALGDPDAWPDRQYDWTVEATPDGGSQLTVSIYPLRSWPVSTNYTFFTQCRLNITYNDSPIRINRLWTDRKVYSLGQLVTIELFLENTSSTSVDLMAEAEMVGTGQNSVYGLLVKHLNDVQGLISSDWTWDSSSAPADTYDLNVRIKTLDGLLLAEQSTTIQIGLSDGSMDAVVTDPVCFGVGNDIKVNTGFTNTGQTVLNPLLIVEIYDVNNGTMLQRFERQITNLAVNAHFLTHWEWTPTRARGDCRFKAYTLYDGKSTSVKFYPQLSSFVDGDFNMDSKIDLADFARISSVWLSDDTICDIAPDGGDCLVDIKDLNIMIDTWLNGIENISGPACNTAADLNCDGNVDVDDLLYMAGAWLTNNAIADIAEPADGIVDGNDFSVLSRYWLN
jgi:hypothetical protein